MCICMGVWIHFTRYPFITTFRTADILSTVYLFRTFHGLESTKSDFFPLSLSSVITYMF